MAGQGDRRVDSETELHEILEALEKKLIRRVVAAHRRMAENLLEEMDALDLVLDVRQRIVKGR